MVKGLPDAAKIVFDDHRAVSNAGVLLPSVLAGRLGIEALVNDTVRLGDRDGAANPGRTVMTLVSTIALGADCIDDCNGLRSGQTVAVLGHGVAAPLTLGTFLRTFTFGQVRQLDRVPGESLCRAWQSGAGPGDRRLVGDVDSFVGEVYGKDKQGTGYVSPSLTGSGQPSQRQLHRPDPAQILQRQSHTHRRAVGHIPSRTMGLEKLLKPRRRHLIHSQTKSHLIDYSLLRARNEIAYGQYADISAESYSELHGEALSVLESIRQITSV